MRFWEIGIRILGIYFSRIFSRSLGGELAGKLIAEKREKLERKDEDHFVNPRIA